MWLVCMGVWLDNKILDRNSEKAVAGLEAKGANQSGVQNYSLAVKWVCGP